MQMIHPGPEHCKELGHLIGYLKVKETRFIFIRRPKVLKATICCDYNYATDKVTRKSISTIVAKLGGTLITFLSKTQRTLTLISIAAEYVALLACAQEVKFFKMLLEEMAEVQNPSVVHENNQGAIFLANNKQVGICTKHIDICHHILREVIEDKDMDIKYIINEENPADITMIKFSDANYIKHMKIVSCPLLPVNPNTIGQPNSR